MVGIFEKISNVFKNIFSFGDSNEQKKVNSNVVFLTYKVKSGDTASGIALKYGISVDELRQANGLDENFKVKLGQTLNIPKPSDEALFKKAIQNTGFSYVKSAAERKPTDPYVMPLGETVHSVKKGETLSSIERKYELRHGELAAYNNLNLKKGLSIGQKIKIPERVLTGNIRSLKDVAAATGVSVSFLKTLEKFEAKMNKAYIDPKGYATIGVGHMLNSDFEKKYYAKKTLSNKEVYILLAKDIAKVHKDLKKTIGQDSFDMMQMNQKDSLTDYVFNRGVAAFKNKCPNMIKALKNKEFKKAGALFDLDTSSKNILYNISRRRMFEMAHYFEGNIPSFAVKYAQRLYNIAYSGNINREKEKTESLNNMTKKLFKGKVKIKN